MASVVARCAHGPMCINYGKVIQNQCNFNRLSFSLFQKFHNSINDFGDTKPPKKRTGNKSLLFFVLGAMEEAINQITKDKYTVMKVLSSTVKEIPFHRNADFIDDPVHYPKMENKKEKLLEATQLGKQAAKFFLQKFPEKIIYHTPEPAWSKDAVEHCEKKIEISVENLISLLTLGKENPLIIDMYEKLKDDDDMTIDIRNQVLDYAIFYDIPLEKTSENSRNEVKVHVSGDSYAEKLFLELKENANGQTYEVYILGLLHHGLLQPAFNIFNEIKNKDLSSSAFLYEQLLNNVSNISIDKDERWQLVKEIVDSMNQNGVKPTLSTINAFLHSASNSAQPEMYSYQIFEEMRDKDIAPSIETFYLMLRNTSRVGDTAVCDMIDMSIKEMKAGRVSFEVARPTDVLFFASAMNAGKTNKRLDLAKETMDVLVSNNLHQRISEKKNVIYMNYLCTISSSGDVEFFLKEYNRIIPAIVSTYFVWFFKELLENAIAIRNPSYIPRIFQELSQSSFAMEKVIDTLFEAMSRGIPPERAEEYLSVMKACHEHMDIHKLKLTSNILSTSIHILCLNNLEDEAFEIAKTYHSKNINLSFDAMMGIVQGFVQKKNKTATLSVLQFMASIGNLFYGNKLDELLRKSSILANERGTIKSWFPVSKKNTGWKYAQ